MELITVVGVVSEIIYKNSDNGFAIFDVEGEEDLFTAKGYVASISEGEKLSLTGNWITHPEYGEQFKISYYESILPTKSQEILKYLSSGTIYGIRAKTAEKIVSEFGDKTLDVIKNTPLKLAKIKGISKDKAQKIGESFAEIQSMQNIVMFLQQYDISANMSVKIYQTLGSDAVNKIRINPYLLADNFDGIKFEISDKIAKGEGFALNNPLRLMSGMKYLLTSAAYFFGHTFLPKEELVKISVQKLSVCEDEIINSLSEMIVKQSIYTDKIGDKEAYYLASLHEAETYTAMRLFAMSNTETDLHVPKQEIDAKILDIEQKENITFAEKQKEAINYSVTHGCLVLTGGPGTGKTTTINTILSILKEQDLKVALAAPTGRAAKRMTELTGIEAKTIHRLLGATGEEGASRFTFNEENPIQVDVVILDEVSMIDISLMGSFLHALRQGTKLIMAGDSDQLPSVGPGNVLSDIIKSGIIPTVTLDKIFRQAEESLIVVNAHKINHGEKPIISEKTNDFFFLKRNSTVDVSTTIVDLYKNRLPKSYSINPMTDIQVLSPSKKGNAGVINLNHMLQEKINPESILKNEYSYGKTLYREGDKVMQIKNNYDLYYTREDGDDGVGIFNGDMGIIDEISTIDKFMRIKFDEEKIVEYPFSMLDELDLAYAITVHKSQGSEFHTVIMPVTHFPPMLMCRNLFYTAITRAKNMVILVGSEQAIEYMTSNNRENLRYTGLKEKIVGFEKKVNEERQLFDTCGGDICDNG